MMGKRARFRWSGVTGVIPVIAKGGASCHLVTAAV
jgi:hypothetical protein